MIDFSDPQGGKGACDRKAAHIKNHINKYLNAGNDVETPEQMRAAVESFGGIPGVKVVVCNLQDTSDECGKWEGVLCINNIEYSDNDMKTWKAYDVGPGKVLSLSDFQVPTTLPKVINNDDESTVHDTSTSFTALKSLVNPKVQEKNSNARDEQETESS